MYFLSPPPGYIYGNPIVVSGSGHTGKTNPSIDAVIHMQDLTGTGHAHLCCFLCCKLYLTVVERTTTQTYLIAEQCYEEAGMWRDALRVCQRHLPHLAHKVQTQYQVKKSGRPGGRADVRTREWALTQNFSNENTDCTTRI